MTHLDQEAETVLRAAQLTVVNAKWHIREEQALARLARERGLACTPLFPGHAVIQVVACGGQLLGRTRLHRDGRRSRWIAVPAHTARTIGAYRTAHGAARALARRAGLRCRRVRDQPVDPLLFGPRPATGPRGGGGERRP
ncbi:hypothetical protein [Streptomyces sp. 8L]|uniref:hypothetical protein n=1 Tax=Streptomyces sp. 8L TaxID=2877242 RepID=UPI001CD6D655|nr:hypothetical protein [Streptomyces sp. 8L]MCA1218085.1 hypothetical protein [Streptomyces sp. 8L]